MTSTVLDVTVLLLCVSASVVALGPAGDQIGSSGPTVDDIADRIATETVTVTYEAPDAPNETRTVHATRAELLAMIAVPEGQSRDGVGSSAVFENRVRSAVSEGLYPRTRLDVHTVGAPTKGAGTENATEDRVNIEAFDGPESANWNQSPASSASQTSGTGTGDTTWWSANEAGTPSWPTTGTGTSWAVVLHDELERGASRERRGTDSAASGSEVVEEVRTPLSLGPEPPRSVDTTVAVLSHPVQKGSSRFDGIRITVRRW